MRIKDAVRRVLSEKNPLAIARINKMRQSLQNNTPSLLCPNCIGGILFHDLGLRFRSPTINTMMIQDDFVKYVLNLEHYLQEELCFYQDQEYDCPCARLGDIVIHFTHYKTELEAKEKWIERSLRIDRDNLFVVLQERDGLTMSDMKALGRIHARGLVIFTAHSYPELPYAVQIRKYEKDGSVGNILKRNWLDSSREYEKYFDFVKWFNEANGGGFDASPYLR
jgi:uncharacterized protein (DUF1919 family)